jgi:hypothetical protein
METTDIPVASPLEAFLRDYLETVGGAWDEVEPEVYDVLLPSEASVHTPSGVLRLTFDPEALPEHPGAQLASYGTPLIHQLLEDALKRGRSAHFYLTGVNLNPHNLLGRLRRSLTLAEPLELHLVRVRALHFTQAVYWFQAEFVSDQKEQTILPVGVDLHYGREVRHLDNLLDPARLTRHPSQPLPEARRMSVSAGYAVAREQVLRTLTALANVRARQLTERRDRQIARMTAYYDDLRGELDEQAQRSKNAEEAAARLQQRRAAIDREQQLRVAELMQKSNLRVHLRLLQLLRIDQPKLLVHSTVAAEKLPPVPLELVWDPLTENLEAPPCPVCGRPTFALEMGPRQGVMCPACAATPASKPRHR